MVMMGTNMELMDLAKSAVDEVTALGDEIVEPILNRWSWMNYVRAVLPMVGAVVGLLDAIDD